MRVGFCTGFATTPLFAIDSRLEAAVSSWGFDYIEYPLMSLASLTREEFHALRQRVADAHLSCDCACNLFPASVPVIGSAVSEKQIREYLENAFERASSLGIKKIIFGSAGARKLGDFPGEEADRQFLACLSVLEEYGAAYRIQILLEAIRYGEADYLNTLSEAAEMAELARKRNCPHIGLMADLYHMQSNGESVSDLVKFGALIHHIHVCEADRKLPADSFSEFLSQAASALQNMGYDQSVSYESLRPENDPAGRKACMLLRETFR